LFAHNGTVHGFPRVRDRIAGGTPTELVRHVLGTTDTEAVFFFLLGHLERAGISPLGLGPVDPGVFGEALTEGLDALLRLCDAADTPVPSVNFILTNGEVFAANRSGRELWMATQKFSCRDAETCPVASKVCLDAARSSDRVNHLIVASERIGDEDRWDEVPNGRLVVLSEDFRLSFRAPPPSWRAPDIVPCPVPVAPAA
jgi:glutamine amidotransferase